MTTKCQKKYILDEKTGKCVKRDSVIGKRILVKKFGCKYKKCQQNQICNPITKRCVFKSSPLGKKIIKQEIIRLDMDKKIPENILRQVREYNKIQVSPMINTQRPFTPQFIELLKNKENPKCVLLQAKNCEKYPIEYLKRVGKACNDSIPEDNPDDITPLDLDIDKTPAFCKNLKKFDLLNKSLTTVKQIKRLLKKNGDKKFPSIFKTYMVEDTLYRGSYLKYPLRVFYFSNEFKGHPYVDIYNKKQIVWYYDEETEKSKFTNKTELKNKVKSSKKRYVVCFLHAKSIYTSHSLILLIDKKFFKFYILDPSSTAFYEEYHHEKLIEEIQHLLGKYYESKSDLDMCPIFSVSKLNMLQKQSLGGNYSEKKILDPKGFCAVYTSFIMDTFIRQDSMDLEEFYEKLVYYIMNLGSDVILYDILIKFHSYVTDRALFYLKKDNIRNNPRIQTDDINQMIVKKYKYLG